MPSAPAGAPDIATRIVTQALATQLGQPVIVENRPGAATTIGHEAVARSPADGYTLALGTTGGLATAPSIYPITYDSVKSFAPISLITHAPYMVVVHPALPVKSLKDLIALAKARPGELHFGSGGNGNPLHIAGEMFKTAAGVNLFHVPYKSVTYAVIDLLAGRVQVIFEQPASVQRYFDAGQLRPLAVAAPKRSTRFPLVPTAAEAGVAGYEVAAWFGFLAPAGTPATVIGLLNSEVQKAVATRSVHEALSNQGFEPRTTSPEQFVELIASERQKWARAVKAANIRVD